ncbi:hypothetical protein [Urbifossiella limnaea]|uniref:Uncharacterized protein n=1 Tax=Urbifossiella limnaea TaxID=2528023 RepID=A0A517Y2Y2_9BACT|nr:hypothetical protein [Urbifossiella limnaea]QDU24068.1 hypothetical protein ETAA1_60810 [Urbifossiella limnaea]
MLRDRRSVLAALGLAVPFGIPARAAATGPAPGLRFRSFEDAVREAFASAAAAGGSWRRVEVGHSDEVRAGVQGCHNDRPFAGFPAGHLRIVRSGCEPGPVVRGVRLYVATVDVELAVGPGGRPLDFASIPPAPVFAEPAVVGPVPTRPGGGQVGTGPTTAATAPRGA